METQEYRITRINPGINFSIPCSGGTDFWPINTSWNCSGKTMYQSTGSQIMNAIDFDMGNFPEELRDCSYTNPCVVLWDITPSSHPLECNNIGGYKYVIFSGLKLTSGATTYNDTYNEIIAIYDIENLSKSISLKKQINTGTWIMPNIAPCGCSNAYLNADLYKLTTLLTQDINDIGHYSIWDGNIGQKEVFANFVYSGTSNGWGIQLYNTTDFGYYASLQDSEYEINWGDGNTEFLQYPQLKSQHIYCPSPPCLPRQYTITITHQTPWGPASSSKVITIPSKDYIGLLIEPYVASTTWTGGTGLGSQQFTYTWTPPGTTAQTTSIAYHTMYPSSPLDSGTNINQYSGMGFDTVLNTAPCFTVSGVTDSMLGSFKQYTGATNSSFLPGGYRIGDEISIAGDVLDPITDNYVPGILGKITSASAQYTAYTLYSYVNQRTPIDFYDFPDGITIFIAESCGLSALAFGGGACYECPTDTCDWCLTKDEYIDRTTGNANSGLPLPTPTPKQTQGLWNNYHNYVEGDIVFDKTFNDCCCYMALVDITQSGPGPLSPFKNNPPALTNQGVLVDSNSGLEVHVWEACSPDCVQCPTGSMTPCDDPTITATTSYDDSTVYVQDDYVSTLNGCYQATANVGSTHPTADTTNFEWDYIGCVHWKCPLDPTAPGGCVREPGVGGPNTFMLWGLCNTDLLNGTCYADRWLCENQFDCGACTQISATHPEWGNISSTGPSFTDQNDCINYCKPPVYVCSARTESPCCVQVTCNDVEPSYTSIANSGVWPAEKGPGPFDYGVLTTLGTLNVDFHLTMADCQGTNNNGCCNLSNYDWSCELGCHAVAGSAPWPDLTACQAADHGDFVDALGVIHPYRPESNIWLDANAQPQNICGWKCQTTNTPCVPCFTDICSAWDGMGHDACEQNCSAFTECYVCDCGQQQHCQIYQPCPTLGAGWDGIPTGLFGPDPTNANGGGSSFSASSECTINCVCDAGWDCWIDVHMTSQNGYETSAGGCQYVANSSEIVPGGVLGGLSGWTATSNGPYDSFSACCAGTDCCLVRCNDTWPTWGGAIPVNSPGGEWPCEHVPPQAVAQFYPDGTPIPQGTCGPNYDEFVPFCNMTQCKAAIVSIPPGTGNVFCTQGMGYGAHYDIDGTTIINPGSGSYDDWCYGCPGSGQTGSDTCECACGPNGGNLLPGVTHNNLGPWITSNPYYTVGDTVSYNDASSPLCCYMCNCFSSATPTMEGGPVAIPRQCGVHSPDLGPSFNTPDGTTIVNCWQSCGFTPSGSTSDPVTSCVTCDSVPGPSYRCGAGNPMNFAPDVTGADLAGGFDGGCVEVTTNPLYACTPPMDSNMITQIELQTLANCFSDSNCHHKCNAGCFCEAGGSPYSAGTSHCVTAQQYDTNLASDPAAYGWLTTAGINFQFFSLGACNTLVDPGHYDCCGNPRYNCLSGHTCSDDPLVQASQSAEMYGTMDACVPLYPSDPGYGDAQFRDEVATATTLTLCGGATTTFQATPTATAAYMMCSWYCRWSCSPYLTPNAYCHFAGHDPAELMQIWHSPYNTGPCVNSSQYTSALDCWQGGLTPFSCWCNTDWVDCVPETTVTFLGMGAPGSFDVSNNSTCTCVPALSAGTYHTMDECQNPQNYPNVPSSCCDGSYISWCLAVNNDLASMGDCDQSTQYNDSHFNLIDTNTNISPGSYCTDYQTNESGIPGAVLYEQYYKDGSYVNVIDVSPNLMYSLQTQINVIVGEGDEAAGGTLDDFTQPFDSLGYLPTLGGLCVEPNIPLSILNDPTLSTFYNWNTAGQAQGKCCADVNGTSYIMNRVRTYSHEYLKHANQYLTSVVGSVPQDVTYGFHYTNLDILLEAADYVGITGLTHPTLKAGWNFCETCYHASNDYYLTDIHEISYQISKQYYERIFPNEMGYLPDKCVKGIEDYADATSTNTADTYMSCVTLKTRGCCQKPCFCTEDGSQYTWGTTYTSPVDPFLVSTYLGSNVGPFIMDSMAWIAGQGFGGVSDWVEDPTMTGFGEAYGEGYMNNTSCNADDLACCGQNTNGLVYGCTDPQAFNYDCKPLTYPTGVPCGDGVNVDDGSCTYVTAPNPYAPAPGECVWGCFDDATGGSNLDTEGGGGTYVATNYNPIANCYSACTY